MKPQMTQMYADLNAKGWNCDSVIPGPAAPEPGICAPLVRNDATCCFWTSSEKPMRFT